MEILALTNLVHFQEDGEKKEGSKKEEKADGDGASEKQEEETKE